MRGGTEKRQRTILEYMGVPHQECWGQPKSGGQETRTTDEKQQMDGNPGQMRKEMEESQQDGAIDHQGAQTNSSKAVTAQGQGKL